MRLFLFSAFLMLAIIALSIYLNVLAFTLFMTMPVAFYFVYLSYLLQRFRIDFKPKIVDLLLDFIDDLPNIQELHYDAKGTIDKQIFIDSKIFSTSAPSYKSEDVISGKIGELDFRMGEVNVREFSKARSRLNYVFSGVFLHTQSNLKLRGAVLMLPSEFWEYLSATIRGITRIGGKKIEKKYNQNFEEAFMVYATPNAYLENLLSTDMQDILVAYRQKTKKKIYISFIGKEIYIAITEPKDILEPYLFKSVVSFELVREFFEDILLLINIVADFDKVH